MIRATLAGLLLATCTLAPAARAQDVMTVAQDHYKVLAENPYVRVVENTLQPGEKDPMHTHPAGWFIVTAPGMMRVVFATGKTEIWSPRLHEEGWSDAEGAHTSENVGTTPMSYILVELKGARATSSASGPPPRRVVAPSGRGSH